MRILPRRGRMAWMAELRPCLAGPPARVALDQEQLGGGDVLGAAVGQLARQAAAGQGALAAGQVAGLAGGLAGLHRLHAFMTMRLASAGCSSSQAPSSSLTTCVTKPSTSLLPSLVLVWPSNCGSGTLDGDDGGQALAEVVAAGRLAVLEQLGVAGVGVDRARQGASEARQVRAALERVDVVGEREHRLVVAVVCTARRCQPPAG